MASSFREKTTKMESEKLVIFMWNSTWKTNQNIINLNPKLVIIDSIQTMYSDEITSSPGSVSQVREITSKIMRTCKEQAITTIIIGHVTKDRKHSRTKSSRTHGRYSFIPRRRKIFFI